MSGATGRVVRLKRESDTGAVKPVRVKLGHNNLTYSISRMTATHLSLAASVSRWTNPR